MASTKVEVEESQMQLKHLRFVMILAINAVEMVSNLFDYAKQNSGPLKSTVGAVENAVTAVVGPVYDNFKDVPGDVLVFLDKKVFWLPWSKYKSVSYQVDEATYKFNECAPPLAKKVVRNAKAVVSKASKVAQDLVKEVQVAGPRSAIFHAGTVSKHFAISQLAVVWYKVNHYPVMHGVAEMAIPTAAHWSDKYNNLVKDMTAKGHTIFSYLPLVPVEEMAKAYKQVETSTGKKEDSSSSSESDSNKEE